MKQLSKRLFAVPLALMFVLALAVQPVPGQTKDNDRVKEEKIRFNHDGTVRIEDKTFSNVREYFSSEYFRAHGKRCGFHKIYSPERLRLLAEAENINKSASDCSMSRTTIQGEYYPAQTLTIPTVFHIIYKSDGTGNIPDSRVINQVKALNEDYAAVSGSLGAGGANTKIQFQLVTITRTQNDNWFNDNDEYGFKSALGYNQSRYLNIYVNSAGGYLGYAYLPQTDAGSVYDGVVAAYSSVGGRGEGSAPYNQGRTLTHEIGHYLGLLHTFEGDGCYTGYTQGDLINDTNSENIDHYGCSQTYTCSTADPIHNYMNYTDDLCMNQFTSEQANRMVCSLMNYRSQLYTTGGGSTPSLTVTNPNGGESLTAGGKVTITWSTTGTVGNVAIHYSTNNGSSWNTVTSSTANDGSYSWTVPSVSSSQCLVRIREASDGSPSDQSNSTFSISSGGSSTSITVTNPNGGETLVTGNTETITWNSSGSIANVKIRFSSNNGSSWSTVTSSTKNDGRYSWTVPSISSSRCLIRVQDASDGSPADNSNSTFSVVQSGSPSIVLNRSQLMFGGVARTTQGGSQQVWISNGGTGTLSWSVSDNAQWLSCTPTSGTGTGILTVSVDASSLSAGTYSGMITVSGSNASNSPRSIAVTFKVLNQWQDNKPEGSIDTPLNGSVVAGSIAVTGWAIDDVGLKNVKIYAGQTFIDNAVFIAGARSDIEQTYSNYPANHLSGWGYMMLTHFLPGGGQGYYTISAMAVDVSGNTTILGSKTIYVDNDNSVKPFGALETPVQGGTASGVSYVNWGWALTPWPSKISTDGSTIKVLVNGKYVGNPTYNIYRADIANLFPGYRNSNGAVGYFNLDTTAYDNGVHIIQWTVTDNWGNTDGIGSRFFSTINNRASRVAGTGGILTDPHMSMDYIEYALHRRSILREDREVRFAKGFQTDPPTKVAPGDMNGISTVNIREMERVVIHLPATGSNGSKWTAGYLLAGNNLRQLPLGSTFDAENGVFYWSPGPGFIGEYPLVFVNGVTREARKVVVNISAKFPLNPDLNDTTPSGEAGINQ